jgi:hypothetical protein
MYQTLFVLQVCLVMSITVAQLAKLSDYYGFDLDEARQYIGLGPAKRRGRPASDSSPQKPKAEKPKATKTKAEKPKATKPKPKAEKRSGTTGYLLFMKENKDLIAEQIRNETKSGEKPQNLLSAVANSWKMASDDVRNAYNRKAQRA